MRHWLLTWTTYGTWLPGDERGSVTAVRTHPHPVVREHFNHPGEDFVGGMPGLQQTSREHMLGPPIRLTQEQAETLLVQFQETAAYRGWHLDAVAVMANHIHIVVTIDGDPDPSDLLRDFKSYGSRTLNRRWAKPPNGTWWTDHGSKRKLQDESAREAACAYVRQQEYPLVIWSAGEPTA